MSILAVVPAKGESRRLLGKNLRTIGGETLVELAIKYAKSSERVTDVVVSTDSEEVRQFVESKKLCQCILRGSELSGETDVFFVYQHAWEEKGKEAEYVVGLQPDNPDRTLSLDTAVSYVLENNLDNFFTVNKNGRKNGSIRMYRPNVESFCQTSTLLDDCTNIHTEDDLNRASRIMLVNPNPLNLSPTEVFVIAEAACNHMCSIELAKAMIDCAASAGANSIKFQTYKGERIVTKYAPAFWGTETMAQTEYYKRLDKFEKEDYELLFQYAKDKGIVPFSTPFGIEDAIMLNEIGMEIFKIPSFEIVNLELLQCIASFNKPIVLSTGAATFEEIDKAIEVILGEGNGDLALMACTLSYHTEIEDANLKRIQTLKERYPNFMIGMSDHTLPDENMVIPAISVALGARIIEKHYTMSRTMTGSGHYFSLEPDDVKRMVNNIRLFETVLGDGMQGVADNEVRARKGGRKSVVANVYIKKGSVITKEMLAYKRPGDGISPDKVNELIDKVVQSDIEEDFQIKWEDVSE
jgi:N-acetylneuraminate synthase|tara:strand:- start:9462 stop:11033 length:1572 start_codon:yes stop_codon:yes gene_type:complete